MKYKYLRNDKKTTPLENTPPKDEKQHTDKNKK
jgi:hypothetical protein